MDSAIAYHSLLNAHLENLSGLPLFWSFDIQFGGPYDATVFLKEICNLLIWLPELVSVNGDVMVRCHIITDRVIE